MGRYDRGGGGGQVKLIPTPEGSSYDYIVR